MIGGRGDVSSVLGDLELKLKGLERDLANVGSDRSAPAHHRDGDEHDARDPGPDHDEDAMSDISSTDTVTAAVQAHVAQIVGAAERAAIDLQAEVEHESTRRASAVRLEAEEDAARIRRHAEAAAEAYLQEARLRIDAFASARVERIAELTDALVAQAGAIQARLDDAIDLEGQLRDLVSALGAAARAATAEGARPAAGIHRVPRPSDPIEDHPA